MVNLLVHQGIQYLPNWADQPLLYSTKMWPRWGVEFPGYLLLTMAFLDPGLIPIFNFFPQLSLSTNHICPVVWINHIHWTPSSYKSSNGIDARVCVQCVPNFQMYCTSCQTCEDYSISLDTCSRPLDLKWPKIIYPTRENGGSSGVILSRGRSAICSTVRALYLIHIWCILKVAFW